MCLKQFSYQHRPCLSWILTKGPIIAGELRKIWVLPSLQILNPIIYDELFQDITGAAPIKSLCFIFTIPVHFILKSLCFIFTIPVHFIHSTMKVFKYYFVFIFIFFNFPYYLVVLQRNVPYPAVLWCYTLRGHKHRKLSHQRE